MQAAKQRKRSERNYLGDCPCTCDAPSVSVGRSLTFELLPALNSARVQLLAMPRSRLLFLAIGCASIVAFWVMTSLGVHGSARAGVVVAVGHRGRRAQSSGWPDAVRFQPL